MPRQCLLCNSNRTYVNKRLKKEIWHRYNAGHICTKCYTRNRKMELNNGGAGPRTRNRYRRDMDQRKCFKCDSTTTGKHFIKSANKSYECWYTYKDGYVCSKCYSKSRYKPPNPDRANGPKHQKKVCHICKSETSRPNKNGYNTWFFIKGTRNRICYYCQLKQNILKRRAENGNDKCNSLECAKARQTILVRYDYSKYSYCTFCQANHDKSNTFCPCCDRKLRTKPQRANHKRLVNGKPLVYY